MNQYQLVYIAPYTQWNFVKRHSSTLRMDGDAGFGNITLLASPTTPLRLPSSALTLTINKSLTSDLHPSPSLWVLIIGLSVKHQRPDSPAGLCCQSKLR